jgi:hypothetical protein
MFSLIINVKGILSKRLLKNRTMDIVVCLTPLEIAFQLYLGGQLCS